jgi:2-oxo-4-hydroxy-4-carboxy-5-ureidoimidazoline decarboxylase
MSVLARWNFLPLAAAVDEILPCCGSRAWADAMAARRPLPDEATLMAASDEIWRGLAASDWLEAFRSHPRIGESHIDGSQASRGCAPSRAVREGAITQAGSPRSLAWSNQEQRNVADADDSAKLALAEANREYERRFKRIFIVCATGKSPDEILKIVRRRMENDEPAELREASEQQRQITQIRLRKWLQSQ